MIGPRPSFDRFVRRQERWLRALDLLERPWFVLGGAPDPTLPPELVATHARVDINNSGLTAALLGLGPADLTIRRSKASWTVHPALATRGLIWFTDTPALLLRLRLAALHRRVVAGRVMQVAKANRAELVGRVADGDVRSVGTLGRPSNGVVAACYGLRFGIPEVVLTGLSLSRHGYFYDALGRRRQHVEEDGFLLSRLAREPRLATTEPELAEATGIRLWRSPEDG